MFTYCWILIHFVFQPSFDNVLPVSSDELDLAQLYTIYNELKRLGHTPTIVDAADIQAYPEVLCCPFCCNVNNPKTVICVIFIIPETHVH